MDAQPPAISGSPTSNMEGFILKIRIIDIHGQARFHHGMPSDPQVRGSRYSDLGRAMKGRQFAEDALIVGEMADRRDDRSADLVHLPDDAEAAAEILAALLLGKLFVVAWRRAVIMLDGGIPDDTMVAGSCMIPA